MPNSTLLSDAHDILHERGILKTTTELHITQAGAHATIVIGEKLAAADVSSFKNEAKRLIETGVTTLVLDCANLVVLDSTGIGCLIAMHNSLSRVNGSLAIIQVSADIYELLCSMRLDRRIKMTQLNSDQG